MRRIKLPTGLSCAAVLILAVAGCLSPATSPQFPPPRPDFASLRPGDYCRVAVAGSDDKPGRHRMYAGTVAQLTEKELVLNNVSDETTPEHGVSLIDGVSIVPRGERSPAAETGSVRLRRADVTWVKAAESPYAARNDGQRAPATQWR